MYTTLIKNHVAALKTYFGVQLYFKHCLYAIKANKEAVDFQATLQIDAVMLDQIKYVKTTRITFIVSHAAEK